MLSARKNDAGKSQSAFFPTRNELDSEDGIVLVIVQSVHTVYQRLTKIILFCYVLYFILKFILTSFIQEKK